MPSPGVSSCLVKVPMASDAPLHEIPPFYTPPLLTSPSVFYCRHFPPKCSGALRWPGALRPIRALRWELSLKKLGTLCDRPSTLSPPKNKSSPLDSIPQAETQNYSQLYTLVNFRSKSINIW